VLGNLYFLFLCSKLLLTGNIRYSRSDIDMLVDGTIPQRRVLDLAPGIGDVHGSDGREHLSRIFERSIEY
jgi:hydroxyacid-oxoacid transhydrogenase